MVPSILRCTPQGLDIPNSGTRQIQGPAVNDVFPVNLTRGEVILFNSDRFGEIPRLIDVGPHNDCRMIGDELRRNGVEKRRRKC